MQTALDIRHQVFVDEQGVDPELEYDEFENESTHYLAFFNDLPAGTARWRHTEKGIKLERFAVLKNFRGKDMGKALVVRVLNDAKKLKKNIYLNAQVQVISFYENLGFETTGDFFEEAGIEHKRMEYINVVPRTSINKSAN